MSAFFYLAIGVIALIIPVFLFRAVYGPSLFDRLIGLNGIAVKTIILLVLIGAYNHQIDMFIDISIGYGLLNLVGSIAVGKYLEKRALKP